MKRETFEAALQKALNRLAPPIPDGRSAATAEGRTGGLGGIRYGNTRQLVGRTAQRLAASGRTSKPIPLPFPTMGPPCF